MLAAIVLIKTMQIMKINAIDQIKLSRNENIFVRDVTL